jgi:HD superfamily phosphohydrolase
MCYNSKQMETKRPRIRTLLYGDEHLSAGEIDLLHTPALQRLYDLHQLGLTDRIYIDASHSRLHHVVGVLEQTEKLVAAIVQNLRANPDRDFITAAGKFRAGDFSQDVEAAKPVIRLIGLLHDLTHSPYGHTIEDEIHLVACKHDEPRRQSDAFYHLACQYLGWLCPGSRRATSSPWASHCYRTPNVANACRTLEVS